MNRWTWMAAAALAAAAFSARADDDDGPAPRALPVLPRYQQECSSCHIAYPPGLLPASSWRRLMDNLPRHFGVDASLDAATTQEIGQWLVAHAGTSRRAARDAAPPPEDRISRAPWFVREHREIAAATWQRPSIKSPANCAACHPRAEQGDFSERHNRIPR